MTEKKNGTVAGKLTREELGQRLAAFDVPYRQSCSVRGGENKAAIPEAMAPARTLQSRPFMRRQTYKEVRPRDVVHADTILLVPVCSTRAFDCLHSFSLRSKSGEAGLVVLWWPSRDESSVAASRGKALVQLSRVAIAGRNSILIFMD